MGQDFTDNPQLFITWDALHRDAVLLSRELRSKGPFKGIIAVARGGLVPAAVAAQEMDLRLIDTVCISSYDDTVQRDDLQVLKPIEGDGTQWLVIDDIVDSGRTFRQLRKMLPKAYFAAIYAKPQGQKTVDTVLTLVNQDIWVVFPWETPTQE
jgi:xanthine phosphoribosyltransferase